MNKCVICGKNSGKGKTCGSTCRSKLRRATLGDATPKNATVRATVGIETTTSDATGDAFERERWQAQVDALPMGVSRPTCHPSDTRRNGENWWNTPDYARVIERLLTHTVEELEQQGGWIPAWKRKEVA